MIRVPETGPPSELSKFICPISICPSPKVDKSRDLDFSEVVKRQPGKRILVSSVYLVIPTLVSAQPKRLYTSPEKDWRTQTNVITHPSGRWD